MQKFALRLVQDGGLTAVLIALFGYHLWEEVIHEWLGLVFFALVLLHARLNWWWFKGIFQGKFHGFRRFKSLVNFLLIALLFSTIISGILLSKYLFVELPFHATGDFVRKTHILSNHWLQIIIGIHLGLHWHTLRSMLEQRLKLDTDHWLATHLIPACWLVLAFCGVWIFVQRELYLYLIDGVDFAFFDYDESKITFFIDFLLILIAIAVLTKTLVKKWQ